MKNDLEQYNKQGSTWWNPNGPFYFLKSNKRRLLIPFLALAIFISCVPMATDLRRIGFNEIQKGFDSLDKTPNLYEIVRLKDVKIHIVGDRKYFKWEKAAAYGSPVAGYATTKNEIWVFGKFVSGKIVVNQAILGHEFNHLLNFKNPRIANPDKLDDMGA